MKICHALATLTLGLTATSALHATTFSLPQGNDDLVGKEERITAGRKDTLIDLGRLHGFGYDEISAANPGIDPWMPPTALPLPCHTRTSCRMRRAPVS
jgi:L,D-transpeptidase ErfK/SrfK